MRNRLKVNIANHVSYQIHVLYQELAPRKHKEFSKLNNKEATNPIKKGQKIQTEMSVKKING